MKPREISSPTILSTVLADDTEIARTPWIVQSMLSQTIGPAEQLSAKFQNVCSFGFREFIDSPLPIPHIVSHRKHMVFRYFCGVRFEDRNGSGDDEIALNASPSATRFDPGILSTTVAAAAHSSQFQIGTRCRSWYRNRENRRIAVGFEPAATSQHGRRSAGDHVAQVDIARSPFDVWAASSKDSGFRIESAQTAAASGLPSVISTRPPKVGFLPF